MDFSELVKVIDASSVVNLDGSACVPDSVYHKWFGVYVGFNSLSNAIAGLHFDKPIYPFNGVILDSLNDCLKKAVGQTAHELVGVARADLPDRDSLELLNRKLYELTGDSVLSLLTPYLSDLSNGIHEFYVYSYNNSDKIFGTPVHPERLKHFETVLSNLID
ncbi:MAG TPA: hypothetical protein VI790_03455 [Candidatus Nanoarchaeia archaeon]|nr:MAG: hypothetical protein A2355_00665 [Spirochaetes bacterium RIFOXYB1_FULL_32_8]HLE06385.1 hypothetical protein [Candidatus Nanoarchaeia archaeon]